MYQQIKDLADEAIALQNKDRMDAALREISCMCSLATDDGAKLVGYSNPDTPNPVVLDGPVGDIVAPSPEADAYLAKHFAAEPAPVAKGKKGGAK